MSNASKIRNVTAREVLDSRGFPTVEVELTVDHPRHSGESLTGRAIVPSGASTGEGEALELRDGDKKRYLGKGVLKAVGNVKTSIASAIQGKEFKRQDELDSLLRSLDGTPNKSKLGANAILGVSMAFARAHALALGVPSFKLIGETFGTRSFQLPVPMMNIINGGKHADNGLALQEFMIIPAGFNRFSEALRAGTEVFHALKKILHDKGLSTGVGDEGGFAPVFQGDKPHEQALMCIMDAIRQAGYQAGKDIFLGLDAAASEFSDGPGRYKFEGRSLSASEMVAVYSGWASKYPVLSIEDGLSEHDWEGWQGLTQTLGNRCQLVGDDLFVTNIEYLKKGIEKKAANSILIKLNQIGTVSETLETMQLASKAGYSAVTSHRSGETEDTFIAELAVGTGCGQIKTGSASRTDRIAKYNQLLRIEEMLGESARFAGLSIYSRLLGPSGK
jgi:enolase